jgi:putative oxidoreductase
MQTDTQSILWLVGRLLLGGLFVFGGVHHLFNVAALTQAVAARGVPAAKFVLLAGTGLQTVAGLALMFDVCTLWAAVSLILFTIAASVLLVNFWDMQGPARDGAIKTWQSNLAIVGGLLVAAAHSLAM